MKKKYGYYEENKTVSLLGFPATMIIGNVIYNGLHWHDHVEIILCKKGTTHVRIQQKLYHLKEGDFITINSGSPHEIFNGKEGNLQIICSISLNFLKNMQGQQFNFSTVQPESTFDNSITGKLISDTDCQIMRNSLSEMAYLSSIYYEKKDLTLDFPLGNDENWYRYLKYLCQIMEILSKYKTELTDKFIKKERSLKECMLYIQRHFNEPLNAKILAENLHVSQPTIYRLFSEQAGTHLNDYITLIRLAVACRYIENTPDNIIDIAYSCGFTSLSNFYRLFKTYTGISPKEYRSRHCLALNSDKIHQPDIMQLNQFQDFPQLNISREDLLK